MGVSNFSVYTKFKAADGVSPAFRNMTQHAAKFGNKVQSQSAKAKAAIMGIKNAAKVTAVTVAAIGTALLLPLKAYADWEKGILSVNTLMSKGEVEKYGKEIKQTSREAIRMGFAVEDANKGLFDSVSALGASEKTFEMYRKSIKLAKGGCTDLSIAIDGMTSVINAYGRDTTDANLVANSFFTAQKFGKTTVAELASNVGKIAPNAKAAGVGFDELLSTMAALTLGGLSTDEATTALKGALTSLVKPAKEAEETLQALGVPYGVMQIRQKGLGYTLKKLNEAQKKHPELMAKAIPNIRAYTAVMALSDDKLQMIDNTMKAIHDDAKNGTGLEEAFATMSGSGAATMGRVLGEMHDALIELGEVVAPYLLPLVQKFGETVHWLGEMSPKINDAVNGFKTFGDGVAGVFSFMKDNWIPLLMITPAAILGVRIALDILSLKMSLLRMDMATKAIPAFTGFTTAIWKNVTALWAQAAAWAVSPVGMITIGIIALVGVVILLWKNWDKVTATMSKWWEYGKKAVSGFWTKCKDVFGSIGAFIKTHFEDVLLNSLGPMGLIIRGVMKLNDKVKGLKDNSAGIQLRAADTGQNPVKSNPKIKDNPRNGKINVGVKLDNNTDLKAKTSVTLEDTNNLKLSPA